MTTLKEEILKNASGGIQDSFDPELTRAFDALDNPASRELRSADLVKLHKDKLRVSGDGIFYTLQGEGPTMGMPAVFLRLHVCNLRCVWCDAHYTWNPDSEEFWTESSSLWPTQVAEMAEIHWKSGSLLWRHGHKRLVITGGEPLLQRDAIDELMGLLGWGLWKIEIETNGTIMPTKTQQEVCQFNCSPKLRNSGCSKKSRINPEVLETLNRCNTTFKFVVMNDDDIDEIMMDFLNNKLIDHDKVIVMPQGVTPKEVNNNARNVVDSCKRRGLRLMTRLQVDIWGAKRRV